MNKPKEKRKYYAWNQEDLKRALRALKSKELGLNECSRRYGVPKPTLKRHLLKTNKFSNAEDLMKGRPTVFSEEIELELKRHLLYMDSCMFGLTISDVRRLAFQIAEKNNIPHNFNKNKEMAGKSWYYSFKQRHPELVLRKPESTSINRAKGFNKENVMDFFEKLEKIVDEKGITANKIFNVDETGVSTVQKKPQRVHSLKGKKQVGAISSGERGVNTTAVCSTSASGQYIPPMLIFKRKRMSPQLESGAPPGSIVTISDTGYINKELFVKWLEHFIDVVKPSKEKNVLLLLDGHTTHSKNLEAIELARENGIIMLQLPGHTTHRLQPMDVSIFGPLSTYYIQAVETWMRTNNGQAVTQYEVSQLFSQAYQRAATVGNAISAFRATGVWPVNRHVFQDHDFIASEVFNNQNNDNPNLVVSSSSNEAVIASKTVSKSNTSQNIHREFDETNSNASSSSDVTICESPSILEDIPENSFGMTDKINASGDVSSISTVISTNGDSSTQKTVKTSALESQSYKDLSDGIQTTKSAEPKNYQPETLLNITINVLKNRNSASPSNHIANQVTEGMNNHPNVIRSTIAEVPLSVQSLANKNDSSLIPSSSAKCGSKSSRLEVPINVISPIPKAKPKINKRTSKGIQKAFELTSSPYKNELEQSIQTRAAKMPKIKMENSQIKSNKGKKTNPKITKKRKNDDNQENIAINYGASTSAAKVPKNQPKKNYKDSKKQIPNQIKRKAKFSRKYKDDSSSVSSIEEIVLDLDDDSDVDFEEDSDDYCAMCKGYYYDKKGPKDDWIQCVRCHKWLHDTCIRNIDICPKCLN